jgi:hypothetical protein
MLPLALAGLGYMLANPRRKTRKVRKVRRKTRKTRRVSKPRRVRKASRAPKTLRVGSRVLFGRKRGEKTRGVIVGFGRRRVMVRTLHARGRYPAGTVWRVGRSLLSPYSGGAVVSVRAPRRARTVASAPSRQVFTPGMSARKYAVEVLRCLSSWASDDGVTSYLRRNLRRFMRERTPPAAAARRCIQAEGS